MLRIWCLAFFHTIFSDLLLLTEPYVSGLCFNLDICKSPLAVTLLTVIDCLHFVIRKWTMTTVKKDCSQKFLFNFIHSLALPTHKSHISWRQKDFKFTEEILLIRFFWRKFFPHLSLFSFSLCNFLFLFGTARLARKLPHDLNHSLFKFVCFTVLKRQYTQRISESAASDACTEVILVLCIIGSLFHKLKSFDRKQRR